MRRPNLVILSLAALALGAGAARGVHAQGDEGAGPPPKARVVKDCRRVLDEIVAVLAASAKKDAKAAAKYLRDPHWAVRQVAAVRLATLGLPGPTVRSLKDAARPGTAAPAKDDVLVAAAEKWAADFTPKDDGENQEAPTPGDEGIRIYASLVRNELAVRRAAPKDLLKLVLELPSYAEAAGDKRAPLFIARELIATGEEDVILKDLAVKNTGAAVGEDGKKVFEWFEKNAAFLYFHPGDRGVRVDLEARSAGQPTAKYRDKNAWKVNEGPGSPSKNAAHEK